MKKKSLKINRTTLFTFRDRRGVINRETDPTTTMITTTVSHILAVR